MNPISTKDLNLYNTADEHFEEEPLMPLSRHLEELRIKILICLLALIVTTIGGFFLSKGIITLLTKLAPSGTMFLQIKPGEFFFACVKVSLCFGFLLSAPVVIWQSSGFILPGLKKGERKIIIPVLIATPVLFFLGIIFSYFFVAPQMMNFLFAFGQNVISASIGIENFISFTVFILAISGLTFLLPIAILMLSALGLVNSKMLLKHWRYAILISVICGAILTPTPDPFNMLIISTILMVLYFFSCALIAIFPVNTINKE